MGSGGSKFNDGNNGSMFSKSVQQRYVQLKKTLRSKGKDRDEHSYQEIRSRKDSSMSEGLSLPPPSSGNENIENPSSRKSFEVNNYTWDDAKGGGTNVVVENDEDHYDERMITRRDDNDEFSSPSFRIYCTPDNGLAGKYLSDEESLEEVEKVEEVEKEKAQNQKVELETGKQEKRRKSFSRIIPTGGTLKNLLNVNSCSPRSLGQTRNEKSNA